MTVIATVCWTLDMHCLGYLTYMSSSQRISHLDGEILLWILLPHFLKVEISFYGRPTNLLKATCGFYLEND